MRGQFITLDGIDGAGKSTHLAFMKQWFDAHNIDAVFSREPGGTPVGEALRGLLLDPDTKASLNTETLMMFAARMQHIEDVIEPALAAGRWVVSDRFTDATFAYQGGGRGVPLARIQILEDWVQQGLQPDLTLLLDVSLSVSEERLARTREKDRFEQEARDFFERTRSVYLDRAQAHPSRYVVLDSSQPVDAVQAQINAVLTRLQQRLVTA
ncbi:MAG: dTMP kinase [Neisseriaceae bacterium]|nr:dTMP kinase [Neisseriaceae bacterium]